MATLDYPQQIKLLALRIVNAEKDLLLSLTKKSLAATMGAHRCTWKLQEDGQWKRSCTCGYKNDRCAHTYAAYLMLKQVCQDMEWDFPQANLTAKPTPAPNRPQPPMMAPLSAHPTPQQQHPNANPRQADFFSEMFSQRAQQPPAPRTFPPPKPQAPAAKATTPAQLTVELEFIPDFKGMKVRFYFVTGGMRNLMDLAKVRFEASLVKADKENGTHTSEYTWSKQDSDFLIWVLPQIRALGIPGRPMTLLPVSPADKQIWLKKWASNPGRFIEKRSQQPFNPLNLQRFVSMHFELSRHGENLHVYPVMMAEDGTRHYVNKLLNAMHEDASGYTKELMDAFKPPLPWNILFRYYQYGPANIQFSDAQRQLPPLIDGHFELIRNSEDVVETIVREPKVGIEASTDSKGNFQLTVVVDGRRLHLANHSGGQAISIRVQNGKLHIETFSNETLDTIKAMLREAKEQLQESYVEASGLVFRANVQNAEKLVQIWNTIPHNIKKLYTASVSGLFNGQAEATKVEISLQDKGQLADISFRCTCNGSPIPGSAIWNKNNRSGIYQSSAGDWKRFDYEKVAEAMQALAEEGFDGQDSTIIKQNAPKIIDHLQNIPQIRIADNSTLLLESLRNEKPAPELALPSHLTGIMRPYQKVGFDFLAERVRYGVGTILADDMGLGKTLQVLAVIQSCRQQAIQQGTPFLALVVSPASVIDVWLKQTQQFCPNLKAVALRGSRFVRQNILENSQADILVTHYGLVRTDIEELSQKEFSMVILDEAQTIKNPEAGVSIAVRNLKSQRRLALTGTPLENSLYDLWSILDFLNPGIVGEKADFESAFSHGGRNRIVRLLSLLMLRRSKTLVAPELPPKTEEIVHLNMNDDMERLYARELAKAQIKAMNADMILILSLYTQLRLLCCAPELVMKDNPEAAPHSQKIEYLKEKLQELTEAGHSALVFSQFTSMLAIIERELASTGLPMFKITGETPIPKRAQIVDSFNESDKPGVFLLSLKAAGTGLTLTKADYVFLMDPWWNPAVENQAIDRTHRIGQDKPVFAYKIIIANSIEEKVLDIVNYKRELFNAVIDGATSDKAMPLTLSELRNILGS